VHFSLRTLLVAMLILGCGFGWFTRETRRAKRQQEAVTHFRGLRGHASYDYQVTSEGEWSGKTNPPWPKFLRDLVGDDFLCHIKRVSLHSLFAGDDDFQALSSFPRLTDLRVNVRFVTDEGLSHLKGLKELKHLDLECKLVTDQGMQYLSGLESLTELNLYGTQVTDAGLVDLHGLTNLRVLKVRGTRVTSAGAARLNRVLPNCDVRGVEASDSDDG
jgi:hypothetical protein